MWITLEATDEGPVEYDPGHVIGLGLSVARGNLRRAYTVSHADSRRHRFSLLYRVIPDGRMSPRLAALPPGATVFFHGRFYTPIHEEVQPDAERIVLMATGVGIGPISGYAEKALREGESRPMSLYAGFREEPDVCLAGALEDLATTHADFEWRCTLTKPSTTWRGLVGRLTECVPASIDTRRLSTHHFHLVGNGHMVHLVRRALCRAGLSGERVSIETYFNHYAKPINSEIDALAGRFVGLTVT